MSANVAEPGGQRGEDAVAARGLSLLENRSFEKVLTKIQAWHHSGTEKSSSFSLARDLDLPSAASTSFFSGGGGSN